MHETALTSIMDARVLYNTHAVMGHRTPLPYLHRMLTADSVVNISFQCHYVFKLSDS
jgi:hypothetical protein